MRIQFEKEELLQPGVAESAAPILAVAKELYRAQGKFAPFNSAHEGYAVILEELDELWQEVKHGTPGRQREEAVQVAAMALRFLIDVPGES